MITRVRGRGEIELRSFALTDMVRYGWNDLRSVGTLGEDAVRGIPAIHRAARMRAEAIASLRLKCWQGEGPDRYRVDNCWQARLFNGPANEYQTQFTFWETIEESLAYRGNGYVWKLVDPVTSRITDWYALHPDQVQCKGADEYLVTVGQGFIDPAGRGDAKYELDETTIIHFRGHGKGGTWEAPSPMKVFRDSTLAQVERKRHELRMWTKGTALQQAIVFPQQMSRQEVLKWRDAYRESYEGTTGETTIALGGGAEIKPIGMTLVDAQYAEMAKLTIEDAAFIMAVPANLLGVQLERAVPNLEQDVTSWFRFGLGPELTRIEDTLKADENLFPQYGRDIYPAFDTEGFVRGDTLTEATILVSLVQAGILTPDEARRIRGYEELPGGVGAIPQITPVGGAPNPMVAAMTDAAGTGNGMKPVAVPAPKE